MLYCGLTATVGQRSRPRASSAGSTCLVAASTALVWVAIWAGGQVRCYAPSGQLEAVVEVAAHQTTSCTFGGPDLRDLYVTTSRRGLGEAAEPGAGAVFAVRPGATGQPVLPFLG